MSTDYSIRGASEHYRWKGHYKYNLSIICVTVEHDPRSVPAVARYESQAL